MGPKLKRFLFRTAFAALSCCVLSAISFLAGRIDMANEVERSTLKLERDSAKAVTVATTTNADHALTLETGLLEDAKNTDDAVARGKGRLHALKPAVYTPAPQCGPSAYIIQPGANPDDVWRAYVSGRNGVLYPEDDIAAGVRSPMARKTCLPERLDPNEHFETADAVHKRIADDGLDLAGALKLCDGKVRAVISVVPEHTVK